MGGVEDGEARRCLGGTRERAGRTWVERVQASAGDGLRLLEPVTEQPRDHIVDVDGLAGAGAAPPGAEVVLEHRLAPLAEAARHIGCYDPPFEDFLRLRLEAVLLGERLALVERQLVPFVRLESGNVRQVLLDGVHAVVVEVRDVIPGEAGNVAQGKKVIDEGGLADQNVRLDELARTLLVGEGESGHAGLRPLASATTARASATASRK